jgi:hypothetical protein
MYAIQITYNFAILLVEKYSLVTFVSISLMDDRASESPTPTMGREGSDLLSNIRSPTSSAISESSFFHSALGEPTKSPPTVPAPLIIDVGSEYGMPPAAADDPVSRQSSTSPKQRSGSVHNQALLDELLVAGASTGSSSQSPTAGADTTAKSAAKPQTVSPAAAAVKAAAARGYLVGPVQVRSSSIADVIQRHTTTEVPKNLPVALPLELKLPMALRCDFCIKFDSVCSQCHFKWKGILDSRRIVLFGNFSSVPDHRKVGILFSSICHGSVAFVRHFLEAWPSSIYWRAEFHPLVDARPVDLDDAFRDKTTQGVPIRDAGHVFPLHVAFHAGRLDMVNLLFDLGSIVRKSDRGVAPIELLATPIPDEWEEALENRDSIIEYNMKERAKRLRSEGSYADAALEYQALLARNPRNENARCGVSKMAIEEGRWVDAIELCNAILAKPTDVAWVEFDIKTVQALHNDATRRLHEECHQQTGPALKRCGCIITEKTVVSLRRRKGFIEVFRDSIVPFCDCKTLWGLWRATKNPLLRRWAEKVATASSIDTIGGMLAEEHGYAEMYDALRQDMPPLTGKNAVLHAPARLLGLQVTAMADFNTFFLRSAVVGVNPRFVNDSGFFGFGAKKSDDRRMKLVATKDFRLHRTGEGKAFEVHDLAEWEVDSAATARIIGNIAQD